MKQKHERQGADSEACLAWTGVGARRSMALSVTPSQSPSKSHLFLLRKENIVIIFSQAIDV